MTPPCISIRIQTEVYKGLLWPIPKRPPTDPYKVQPKHTNMLKIILKPLKFDGILQEDVVPRSLATYPQGSKRSIYEDLYM